MGLYALGEQGAFSKLEVEGYSMEMLLAYDSVNLKYSLPDNPALEQEE